MRVVIAIAISLMVVGQASLVAPSLGVQPLVGVGEKPGQAASLQGTGTGACLYMPSRFRDRLPFTHTARESPCPCRRDRTGSGSRSGRGSSSLRARSTPLGRGRIPEPG